MNIYLRDAEASLNPELKPQELRLLAGGAVFAVRDSDAHAACAAADAADAVPKVRPPPEGPG